MEKKTKIITGFDVGGAHLKVTRAENGRIVAAQTFAMPLWQGLDRLASALGEAAPLYAGAELNAFTMTGELSDIFPSRDIGVATLLDQISLHFPASEKLIYAGRSGFVGTKQASRMAVDVASANWHATASLVAKLAGDALFIDMGSTTTDIIAAKAGTVANHGYTDAERLLSGELVYTGFTRTLLFGIAASAPVQGRSTPLMNEYFASIADVHRIMGVLDEGDDKHSSADGKEKTVKGSVARLARMIGRDTADLSSEEWREIARWFSEQQLRKIHDAAFLVAGNTAREAPIVGAGIGRWQIRRLAERMERRFIDFADLIPADDAVRSEASSAAPASAVALLAAGNWYALDEAPSIGPEWRDLMATIGELLLHWGYLETDLQKRISLIEPENLEPSKVPVLTRWRKMEKATRPDDSNLAQLLADVDEVAAIRNCLAHGLTSASADPWSKEEPKVVCVLPDGSRRGIAISEMADAKSRLHSLRKRVRDLPL